VEIPTGFLGTRADALLDLVIVSLVIVIPVLVFSWRQVRQQHYSLHKRIQIALLVVLTIAVGAFEANMRNRGGIFAATTASPYAGTAKLNFWIYFHSVCAIVTTILWFGLLAVSLLKFSKPPQPNSFSRTHRMVGRCGMILMVVTGLTSLPVYIYGFAL
jgi:hypothetical protein